MKHGQGQREEPGKGPPGKGAGQGERLWGQGPYAKRSRQKYHIEAINGSRDGLPFLMQKSPARMMAGMKWGENCCPYTVIIAQIVACHGTRKH